MADHIYQGDCPDETDMTRRDSECPACRAMEAAKECRWYCIDTRGAATLCADREDAEQEMQRSNGLYPHLGPYRAVQLVEVAAQQGAVPDGWKLVPIEPTDAMLVAGFGYWLNVTGSPKQRDTAAAEWAGLLAAAPNPPAPERPVPKTEPELLAALRKAVDRLTNRLDEKYTEARAALGPDKASGMFHNLAGSIYSVRDVLSVIERRSAEAQDQPPRAEPGDVVEPSGISDQTRALLLNVLWHHQGGSSVVGQPIRRMFGIGQYERLTDEQVSEAKRIEGLLAWQAAPEQEPGAEPDEDVIAAIIAEHAHHDIERGTAEMDRHQMSAAAGEILRRFGGGEDAARLNWLMRSAGLSDRYWLMRLSTDSDPRAMIDIELRRAARGEAS